MKKGIIVAGLLIGMLISTGCGRITARKDKSQIVEFSNSKINRNDYTIKFYRINYPKTPHEKDKFYEDFDVLTSKMVAYKKDVNLIIPLELYKDLKNLQKREVREEEKIYYKQAYALTDSEKEIVDSKIKVDFPKDAGSTQKYLNKQVAYWLDYLKKSSEYDKNKYYTELDKGRLIDEVFQRRRFFSNTCFIIENDYALELNNENLEAGSSYGFPIYIRTNRLDAEKLSELKPKIVIVDGFVSDEVIPGKILLINGKNVANVKDYQIKTVVVNVANPLDIISKLGDYKGLELKDILDFKIKHVPNVNLKKASISENERPREKVNFVNIESKWRIEK